MHQSRSKQFPSTVIAFLIVLVCLHAECSLALDAGKNLQQYVLRTWTSEQGLPQNSVRAILQTRDGFLWIGTRGGLARFDGASFVLYKAGSPNSIPSNSVTGLAQDRDGSLWISTAGGLTQYRNGRFHTYGSRDGLPAGSIWRVAADPAGGLWVVSWRSELFHFNGAVVSRYASPIPARPEEVNAILEDPRGKVWVATFDGLFAFDRRHGFQRFTRANGLAGDRVFALALDQNGHVWAAGDGGLTQVFSNRLVSLGVPGLPTATLLAFDTQRSDDTIWTGSTGGGLFRLDHGRVQRLQSTQGLTSDELWLLYFSNDGSLWLGAVDGLNQLNDGAVTSYRMSTGPTDSTIGIQRAQGPEGELWFGRGNLRFHVQRSRLVRIGAVPTAGFNKRSAEDLSSAIPLQVSSNDPRRQGLVLEDRQHRVLLSDAVRRWTFPPGIPWNSVGTVLIGRDGTIWVGGSQDGVHGYRAHGPPLAYTVRNGLDDNNVSALAEDAGGNLWIGTLSGLNRIRHGVVKHVIACAHVTSIDPSPDGSLWVSSESGLIYVPSTLAPVRVFTQHDGLLTNLVEGVTQDSQKSLWLGTEQGIERVRAADLLASRQDSPGSVVVFGTGDGFRNAQVRPDAVFRSRDGNIWFITLRELAMIDPRQTQIRSLAHVVVDGVNIDDRHSALTAAASLTVPPGRHRLTFSYTLPEFRIPGRLRFRYRLAGWDKDWVEAGVSRKAIYTGIPPGHYTFEVANSDGYGSWSPVGSAVAIRVMPYFYETGWFLILLALFAAACIWQLHRLRVAQISARINARMHDRMQERTRIARELHDTLLQGMLGVSMQMYAASQQQLASGSVSSMLGRASQRLREIAEQSRRTVDGLRSPVLAPNPLETMLGQALREMGLPDGMQPQIHSSGAPMQLRPIVQIEIDQIAREAISNAVQHSGASSIRVDILYQPGHFFMSVSDDGCGIAQNPENAGGRGHWGIAGMRERAQLIGGRLRILPHFPRGTVIEISLSGAVAYVEAPHNSMKWIWRRRIRR